MNDFTKKELESIRYCVKQMSIHIDDYNQLKEKIHTMIETYNDCQHLYARKVCVECGLPSHRKFLREPEEIKPLSICSKCGCKWFGVFGALMGGDIQCIHDWNPPQEHERDANPFPTCCTKCNEPFASCGCHRECDHESDGSICLSYPHQLKCINCGEFYR